MTPASFQIRPATLQDTPGIDAVLSASYPKFMSGHYSDAVLAKALPSMTQAQPKLIATGTFYLAESPDDDTIIGCGGWTRERPGSGEVEEGLGHIRHFGVHPNHTRKGVGRRIYERCVQDAKAQGVTKFECWSSLNGEAFYHSLGFEPIRHFEVEMGPYLSFPAVVMIMDPI